MPTTTGFLDVDNAVALDIATKFVTKEYLLEFYPDLVPAALTPQLYLWGSGVSGQIGDNTSSTRSSPVETVSRGTNWKQVGVGANYTAAIKTDGTLWTWGINTDGNLGDNTSSTRSSPVTTAGGGTNWKQVARGFGTHTAAIKTDGTLWTWGRNLNGQLGTNNTSNRSSPVTTVAGGTNWKQVSSGDNHTAAIKTDGTLYTWGFNVFGQLGTNNTSNRSSPVTTTGGGTNWKQVGLGGGYTAAIKTDGTLWTWGINTNGNLGDNTSSNRSSPATTVAGGTNWKNIGVGSGHVTAIKTDGTLWLWGINAGGRLGDNTTSNRSSPITTVAGGTNWKQVVGSNGQTAAIKTDGTLWTWGANNLGQLGDNTTSNRSSPITTVAGGTNWKQVSMSTHTAAIKESEGW